MQQLIFLYCGSVFLMLLSQVYFPATTAHDSHRVSKRHFIWQKSDIFITIVMIWLICFSFLRTSYNDTEVYIETFYKAKPVAEGFAEGAYTDVFGNPLSMFYRSFMRELTDNYHIYFFFPAAFSTVAFVKIFKKYSTDPAFSMLVFLSLGTYITYIASLKQSFAMAFLLLSIPYALDRKYLRFLLFVIIAALFHTYAIFFLIIPLLTEKPWGKITWTLFAITLFAMLTYDATLGALIEYVESLGAEMHENEIFYEKQLNIFRVLVYWVPAILALIFQKRLFRDSGRTENLFVNISILSALFLSLGLVKGANLMGRMAAYFEFATCIALPWMLNKVFTRDSVRFLTVTASVLYFIYFYYEFGINKNFGESYSAITLWQFIQSLFVQ